MKLQRLLSLTRQAVDEFHMIEEGDKIAVGISGGKDRRIRPQRLTASSKK